MQILAIGNSFSSDATRYLHGIARAGGVPLQVTNLYIGGCSLERHFRNMHSDARAYDLQCNGHSTGFSVSLSEALLSIGSITSLAGIYSTPAGTISFPYFSLPFFCSAKRYMSICRPIPRRTSERENSFLPVL